MDTIVFFPAVVKIKINNLHLLWSLCFVVRKSISFGVKLWLHTLILHIVRGGQSLRRVCNSLTANRNSYIRLEWLLAIYSVWYLQVLLSSERITKNKSCRRYKQSGPRKDYIFLDTQECYVGGKAAVAQDRLKEEYTPSCCQ